MNPGASVIPPSYLRSMLVPFLSVATSVAAAQNGPSTLRAQVETYVQDNQEQIVSELREIVSIPSVVTDAENIRRKAEGLREMLSERGFSAQLLETQGNPLVYGDLGVANADQTLLFYCHYDGQPVDPSSWNQPDPFEPVLRDGRTEDGARVIEWMDLGRFERHWRLYARSAADDTAPIVAILSALDALRSMNVEPTSNVRIILDGEEEDGSPSLVPAIARYRKKLEADLMLILDGPVHASGRPTLALGSRGIMTLELTVYGPKFPLHSGHYGNWAPNPAMRLAQLLASMKDDRGRAVIEGFYEGIELSEEDQRILDTVPDDHEGLMRLFGFAEPDAVGRSLQEAIQYPSLNIRGLRSAWVGDEARTIIPQRAVAALDVRLVSETDGAVIYDKILAHIRRQGYHITEEEPDDATRAKYDRIVKVTSRYRNAFRTPLTDPQAQRLIGALTRVWSAEPVVLRTLGGTVPIGPFIEELGIAAVVVPLVNFDNNQHSPNENIRLGHFFDGIVTVAALLTL